MAVKFKINMSKTKKTGRIVFEGRYSATMRKGYELIQLLAKIGQNYDFVSIDEVAEYVDDAIFCMLVYLKENGIEDTFNVLCKEVIFAQHPDNEYAFAWALLQHRAEQNLQLIKKYKDKLTPKSEKQKVKNLLTKRGFLSYQEYGKRRGLI